MDETMATEAALAGTFPTPPLRLDLALGVRHRHAPKRRRKKIGRVARAPASSVVMDATTANAPHEPKDDDPDRPCTWAVSPNVSA